MSLGIVFKGPEGIVLSADSRVTISAKDTQRNITIPATYDNATKLLRFTGHDYIGAVTYGLGVLGQQEPRTAHSYIPEFEAELADFARDNTITRFTVEQFTQLLSDFFMTQWEALKMPMTGIEPLTFLVAGFDEDQPYGRIFQVRLPLQTKPQEQSAGRATFGITVGGQDFLVQRLLAGFDGRMIAKLAERFDLDDAERQKLHQEMQSQFQARIPYQFLSLQDSVDLAITLIRSTMAIQSFMVDVRGVGGHIDVATITKTDGFGWVQQKAIRGEG